MFMRSLERSASPTCSRYSVNRSAFGLPIGSASKLVVLVFEQDVERRGGRCVNRNSWIVNRRNLFEQLPQILKHGLFFLRARAISQKEIAAVNVLLAVLWFIRECFRSRRRRVPSQPHDDIASSG